MDPVEFKKLLFSIRNMEILTTEQIKCINIMNDNQREITINAYNEVMKGLTQFIVTHL